MKPSSPAGERVRGAERANYQIFLAELCDLLGLPRPEPSVADEVANRYVFDKAVTFTNPDGKTSTGYIDLYRRGAFVCVTKQSVVREAKDPLSVADPSAPKPRRKSGTSVRGTAGWDDSMIAARGQAEGYVRALADDNPPFLLVIDIGHSFELYADFSRLGKVYTAFPDARSHRFSLDDLRDEGLCERLKMLWLDPLALDPARHAAKVTREIAARIAVLARRLEAKRYEPEQVAWFLIRCLFTFFSEDVCLTPRGAFTSLLESMKETPEQFVPLVSEVWKTMGQGGFSTALRTRLKQFKGTIFRRQGGTTCEGGQAGLAQGSRRADTGRSQHARGRGRDHDHRRLGPAVQKCQGTAGRRNPRHPRGPRPRPPRRLRLRVGVTALGRLRREAAVACRDAPGEHTSLATANTPIWAPTPEKMQAAIKRLVAVAQPMKIILFGSQARGDADDHSDVDLLVIKPHVADHYEEIIELDRSLAGILMPVDNLLVSEFEFEERADQPGTVERAARQEGRVLYAA